ncbi:MAG: hypothetical protein LUH63_07435 [Parabacteroides sp.]|nr:hypothetical protein [Parabacteroides sp.]
MMRKISILTSATLLLLLILVCNSYRKEEKEPCYVTYQVSIHDMHPHKLLISYQTADSLKTFFCYDKKWKKVVCLPSKEFASIFVQDIFDPKNGFVYLEEETSFGREWDIDPISVRIIYKNKVLLTSGSKFLHLPH